MRICAFLLFAGLNVAASAQAKAPSAAIVSAVASPNRPATDTARDAARHPAALLAFAGVKPGDVIADIMPGQGYFTRIFSAAAGPSGHVFAVVPEELAQIRPPLVAAMRALAAEPALSNVTVLVQPSGAIATPQPIDIAWTSNNYHDLYGFFGADQAAKFDRGVFQTLKPGGVFIVIDHVAKPGTSASSPKSLHRIDPETVKSQVTAAGFKLEAESNILQNPHDPHDIIVFAPTIKGHTDQFVFRFRKP